MIGFVRGTVIGAFKAGKTTTTLVVWPYSDMQSPGTGISVVVSQQTAAQFVPNTQAEFWLYTVHTEKEAYDIGMTSLIAMDAFIRLLDVSGVGPKTALQVVDSLGVEGISEAVRQKDPKLLTKVPGLGSKTAAKILLELSGKGENLATVLAKNDENNQVKKYSLLVAAMQRLGYTASDAKRAVEQVVPELEKDPTRDISEQVKLVLAQVK